jgi:trimeric autotransporter adhesin
LKQLRKHLTFANVLSCVALFMALSGAAYAATAMLPKKSVKTAHLANGSVTTLKLRGGAVTTLKLRNGAVTGAKIAPGAVGTSQIANGSVRSGQLGGGVVTEAKLKNGAVTENKLGASSVATGKVQDGAVTAAKLSSSLLAQLVKNVSYVTKASESDSSTPKAATAECPAGKIAIAGGSKLTLGTAVGVALGESAPTAPDAQGRRTGWTATAHEVVGAETESWSVEAYAVCAEL